ncbi:MAG TPA: diacylglyceryl transferase, partial [Phenylobacterium sp.]|nr:diacylglyceryl transferase [Phenylobacterium sp.]
MIHIPTAPWAHTVFDLAGWGGGLALGALLYRWRLRGLTQEIARKVDGGYFAALVAGAIPGAWLAGSLNTLRASSPALSHSVV